MEIKMKIEDEKLSEEEFIEEDNKDEEESPIKKGGSRRVATYPIDFTIDSINNQIEADNILLDEDFQRYLVWDENKQSKLIESLYLNIPIPVCYFAELEDGKYSVIDGKQRLSSISIFLSNDLILKNLKIASELNGKKQRTLEPEQLRKIESRTIRCIVILKESDSDVCREIFDRLNSNSVPLNKQELRNSTFRGKFNDFLKELAKNKAFQNIRGVDKEDKRMNNCELALRYFAFKEKLSSYRPPLAEFLDNYLKEGNKFSDEKIELEKKAFIEIVKKIHFVFDKNAFRRYDLIQKVWETRINKAIFDVIMLSFTNIDIQTIKKDKEKIIDAFKDICGLTEFNESITTWTKTIKAINARLNLWRDRLEGAGIILPKFIVSSK
ncbi:hypothetical protein COY52_03210 [Candidatus Desantisbacteria bacterium CG_4_10_14_0_8_um_filter_48_22]|uniref:GmrSD restriction endonucleases N-terminal domain-containing protein n=1 Tax=Candidatus Desantisbacteria bacterium CG_4_10_14_0_8_um_filter_48_22 TaxID=1974543 RepID=A0A2M7SE03_9BACT|nr:MAG: hypothetical protein COY52_03210 [Candidatus Desantisbacteria bacterium CG_4_10_14_0_8_um_filter_48_22]